MVEQFEEWASARAERRKGSCRPTGNENERSMIVEKNVGINTASARETNIEGEDSDELGEDIPMKEGAQPDTLQQVDAKAQDEETSDVVTVYLSLSEIDEFKGDYEATLTIVDATPVPNQEMCRMLFFHDTIIQVRVLE